MNKRLFLAGLLIFLLARGISQAQGGDWKVDFRYRIPWWQTSICLPDDWQKTLVGKSGEMLYDYEGKFSDFQTRISVLSGGQTSWVRQELLSPRVPIVRTFFAGGEIEMLQEAFAAPPSAGQRTNAIRPREDIILVKLTNKSDVEKALRPSLLIESTQPLKFNGEKRIVEIGSLTSVSSSEPFQVVEQENEKILLILGPLAAPAHGERALCVTIARGEGDHPGSRTADDAWIARSRAQQFWTGGILPYDRLRVPDPGIQSLVESSMRNIFQAREIKNGLPAFQVGPTCYRSLFIVDGAFILEAATYFGCADEVRPGIMYMLSHQRADGGFTLLKDYWKESGIVLWAVTRHARLTGDKEWLEGVWPKLERAWGFIEKLREQASKDPSAPYYRLLPPGFPDGGIGGTPAEFTNVYWTLAGMKAAVEAARWLGRTVQADAWQKEYDDFYRTFRRAAERDMRIDPYGNRYLPIIMLNEGAELPQRAQWAFCHAVFPGKVFSPDDPLVQGNMAMLRATEKEGMVFGTGWAADGIWNYFASFYGHAWLWMGDGQKAARVLYDYANHAAPLLTWREEQMPQGKGESKVGDMPHNWASAEFIRLVRHLLVLERGDELHLLEGLPPSWIEPGAVTELKEMPTEFGPMSLEVRAAEDGRSAVVRVDAPERARPKRIVLHLGGWAERDPKATVELKTKGKLSKKVEVKAD